jgi:hypothetical protein
MKVIYVFHIKDQTELDKYRNYHLISKEPENRDLCIYREKWQEIEHFSKIGHCVFWVDGFMDVNFNRIIRPEGILIPRMSISQFERFPYNRRDYARIVFWYKHYHPGRKIIHGGPDLMENNFDFHYNEVKNSKGQFFIKSARKHWSYAGSLEGWHDSGASGSLCGEQGEVMVSEFLNIKEDDMSPLTVEYRCYYFFGKLCSISRYDDYVEHEIPEHITAFARSLIGDCVGKALPESVVIDIADTDKGPVFLEANDVSCSGRYVMNKLETFPLEV